MTTQQFRLSADKKDAMLQPQLAAAALFAPLGTSMTRAVDVLQALPDLLPFERMGAGYLLNQFAADRFGMDANSSLLARDLMVSIQATQGESFDGNLAVLLADSWRALQEPAKERDEITQVIVRGPSFRSGPVRFYQDPFLQEPVRPHTVSEKGTVAGGYLATNENHFSAYYPQVAGLGGVVLGIGSLQNFDLALAAGASGLVFCDASPLVAMTLALLMPQLGGADNRYDFGQRVFSLIRRGQDPSPFLDPIPTAYQPAFMAHIDALRDSSDAEKSLSRLVKRLWNRPESFLGNDDSYRRAADLVEAGGVSIAYGNFFGPGMPAVVDAALSVYEDPVRVVHLTNAPEQMVVRKYPVEESSLMEILDRADPEGRLLLSTEFTSSLDVRRNKRAVNDQFSYHATTLGSASRTLRAFGGLRPFINRFRDQMGLVTSRLSPI